MSLARAGTWWMAASGLFWLAWLLMPGVGVTDAEEIFRLVGAARTSVLASVVAQLASAAAYAPGCVALLTTLGPKAAPRVRLGCTLLLVGAAGSAADAVLHLVAVQMTAPGVEGPAVLAVMRWLQGPGLALLLPLIAAFFAGHALLLSGLRRSGLLTPIAPRLLAAAPPLALAGAALARAGVVSGRAVGLAVLAAVAGSLAFAGFELRRAPRV